MDSLRNSIGLRAYGQRDPLIEYKVEAQELFDDMMVSIKSEICHNIFRSASSLMAFENFLRTLQRRGQEQAGGGPGAYATSGTSSSGEGRASDMVTRSLRGPLQAGAGPGRAQGGPQRSLSLRQRQEIQTVLRKGLRAAGPVRPLRRRRGRE